MEYNVNLSINEQNLSVTQILSVNGTVDIIRCHFTFAGWEDFPARLAIFQANSQRKAWIASIVNDTCLIPWEALTRAGDVMVALVGTNTDGQVQRTETKTVVVQKATLQGGVNSIEPTPDQYAQFIAEVEEMIGEAGVLSVNGMTGVVTLTASDVDALPDTTVIPTKTSDLDNDSGFLSSIPAEYVTDTELSTALSDKVDYGDLATVAFSGSYNDLLNKPTIPTVPTNVSAFNNDAGYITSAPVSSVNSKTGAVTLTASDVGALPSNTTFVSSVNGSSGAVTINVPTKTSDLDNDSGFITSAVTSFNGNTGAVTYTAPVSSVNGQTGAVTLTASDVGALPSSTAIPTKTSDLVNDSGFLTSAPVSSVNGRTGAVTGLQEATQVMTMTSSDTSVSLQTDKFYVWPQMSTLTVTVTSTGMYAFRFTSGSTATTLTVTGATMPDSFTVDANKVYEVNIYQGYGVASSWIVS